MALSEILEATEPVSLKQRFAVGEIDRKTVVEHLHLRAWAALLARKMDTIVSMQGLAQPTILLRWQEVREKAVLPEIRRA